MMSRVGASRVGSKAWLVASGFGILVGLWTVRAQAVAPTCFPVGGGGVPGQPGAPDWTTGTAPYDDPRWIGSYGFGQATVMFNALVEGSGPNKTLLLRWHVTGDAGPALAGDQVWVGFYDPTGTGSGTILQVTRDALVSTDGGAGAGAGTMSISAFTRSGGAAFWSSATVPAAIASGARLDAFCETTGGGVTCDEWIIRLRVPLTAAAGGIDLPDPFGAWYEVDVEHGDTGTTDEAKWPTGVINVDQTTAPVTFPDPAGVPPWFSVTSAGGACAAGVEIQPGDISVVNSDGTGTQIALTGVNTFHARPINNTMNGYSPNAVQAKLRIADWGSFVGDSPRWDTVPDPSCAAATGPMLGNIGQSARFDLTCTWTLTTGQQCDYGHASGCTPDALGTRDSHQCIIADLSSTSGPVPFSTSSAWNNFNFDHASNLDRPARIDIGTLGPRDVYVYIATNNLPEKVGDSPPPVDQQVPGRTLSPAAKERMGALATLTPGRVTEKDAIALRGLVAAGRITYADVAKVMPTYTAYVWHDSGTIVKTKTGTAKLLVPQPSFTLFVSHDGPLVGWTHDFGGLGGSVVTKIARDYYKIAVGSTGSVQVLTSVKAIERNGPPLWMILLGMLIFLILIWIIIKVVRG
jgi:hypothetical protein